MEGAKFGLALLFLGGDDAGDGGEHLAALLLELGLLGDGDSRGGELGVEVVDLLFEGVVVELLVEMDGFGALEDVLVNLFLVEEGLVLEFPRGGKGVCFLHC